MVDFPAPVLPTIAIVFPVGHVIGDVDFAADDGLYAMLLGFQIEGHGTEQVAMVGHGGGRKAEVHSPRAQILQTDGSVEQTVLGMTMQMGKTAHDALGEIGILKSGKRRLEKAGRKSKKTERPDWPGVL